MTQPQQALAKTPPAEQRIVIIDGQRYRVQTQRIEPLDIQQQSDPRPAQYQTLKTQGIPPQIVRLPKLPSALSLTLSAIIALSFLVAASMFSIGLTSYSNSVERTHQNRSFFYSE